MSNGRHSAGQQQYPQLLGQSVTFADQLSNHQTSQSSTAHSSLTAAIQSSNQGSSSSSAPIAVLQSQSLPTHHHYLSQTISDQHYGQHQPPSYISCIYPQPTHLQYILAPTQPAQQLQQQQQIQPARNMSFTTQDQQQPSVNTPLLSDYVTIDFPSNPHERLPSYKSFHHETVVLAPDGSIVAIARNRQRRSQSRRRAARCAYSVDGRHDFIDDYSWPGILAAVLFFPVGLICCFTCCRHERCLGCGLERS